MKAHVKIPFSLCSDPSSLIPSQYRVQVLRGSDYLTLIIPPIGNVQMLQVVVRRQYSDINLNMNIDLLHFSELSDAYHSKCENRTTSINFDSHHFEARARH